MRDSRGPNLRRTTALLGHTLISDYDKDFGLTTTALLGHTITIANTMTIANLKGSREPSNDSRYPFLIYCSLWRDADVKSLPTVQPLARLQLESGAMQMRNFCSNFCFRGSMASQRSDAVECVHCFAGSMASQRDGAYTSQWTIKFMHCKTCAQIVCEFCMRNHSDCTPW